MDKVIPFPDKKYSVIYADPPWQHNGTAMPVRKEDRKYASAPSSFYSTMKTADICSMPVVDILEEDALLFLWVVSPMLEDGLKVGCSWGFKYITVGFVWDKQIPNAGHYTLSQTEMCLVFKRGKIPQPRGKRNIKQFLSERRRSHSQKPDIIRDKIVEMFPHHERIELFAREHHPGWDAWGNEV